MILFLLLSCRYRIPHTHLIIYLVVIGPKRVITYIVMEDKPNQRVNKIGCPFYVCLTHINYILLTEWAEPSVHGII